MVLTPLIGRNRTFCRQYLYAFPTPAYLGVGDDAVTYFDGHGVGLQAINYLTQTNHLPLNVEVVLDDTQRFPDDANRIYIIIVRFTVAIASDKLIVAHQWVLMAAVTLNNNKCNFLNKKKDVF